MKNSSVISLAGLLLALFVVPLVILSFNFILPSGPLNSSLVTIRELSIFAVTGLLLLYILKVEKLGLDSIGLYSHDWGKSLLWALLGLVASVLVALLTLWLLSLAGISFGQGSEAHRYDSVSLWAITLMVLRAGIVEEICYRGYAMERLEKISPKWAVHFLLPLVIFALWHYRQGIGGIMVSFTLGGVLAFMYWKKRDLKANIITHFLVDFIPNVLIPLLGGNN